MPKRGQQSPALAYGGRPKPGHPSRAQGRPVPRPHSSLAGAVPGASPADNARERPARSRATAAVFARSPFPVRAVARLDSPAPCPRRTGPFPPPRSARDGGRRPGPHGAAAGAARPLRTHRGRSRLRRCGRPRAVPGEQLSESAAGPRAAAPGPSGEQSVGASPAGGATAPAPRTSVWVPRRPCRCSRSPAGSDHARGDSPPSWMGGTRRPRRCGRRRGRSGRGAGRGPAGAAGEGSPVRAGRGAAGRREGLRQVRGRRSRRVAPFGLAPVRRCCTALVRGRARPGSPAKPLRPHGISGRWCPAETAGSRVCPAPAAATRSGHCDKRGTRKVRPLSRTDRLPAAVRRAAQTP